MFTQTVLPETLDILKKVMQVDSLKTTRLVGGTSLALQLDHRFSVDIDLFGNNLELDNEVLLSEFAQIGKFEITNFNSKNAINSGYLEDVKLDIVTYNYPWLDDEITTDGIRMATTKDIAAMKISAIGSRGAKKDFYDLYFLLEIYSIHQILSFFSQKYNITNTFHYIQSLVYFDDAEKTEQPKTFKPLSWEKVKARIIKEIQNIDFEKLV